MSLLLDFYGPLLTERQRYCMELHYEEDNSLGEIAEALGVSRQAVHDNLQRAQQLLAGYEEKLQLVTQYTKQTDILTEVRKALAEEPVPLARISQLLAQLEK